MITNRIFIKAYPYKPKSIEDAVAGDLLCYYNGSLLIYPQTQYGGTPIGVVVIPTSHDVYGDGSCGVMSLVPMDYNTPDTGGNSDVYMYYGSVDKSGGLKQYNYLPVITKNGTVTNTIVSMGNVAKLSTDYFTALQNINDPDTYYNTTDAVGLPSPYNADDTRNALYYKTDSPSNDANALSDFNGKTNTSTLISQVTAQPNWKTDSTIINEKGSDGKCTGHYPAACCCWRFHTVGTKQGDWYLPACGELGYMMSKFTKIQNGLQFANGVLLDQNYVYWTSTNYNNTGARVIYTDRGYVAQGEKINDIPVRAFMKVDATMIKR